MNRRLPILLLPAALLLLAGCNYIKALGILLRPPHTVKAEYKIEKGKVAIIVDPAHPEEANPVFEQALMQKLKELFAEKKSPAEFVSYGDLIAQRQRNPDFGKWTIQHIGHDLGADYVLYLRVERLSSRTSPAYPVVEPSVLMQAKLIDVGKPHEQARVWPPEKEGREVHCVRQSQEASSADVVDTAMAKLAHDAANLLILPFFDYDEEEKPPVEK